ncbi:MAG: VacJ family lipoprotein [Chromatiaceae bacterium]
MYRCSSPYRFVTWLALPLALLAALLGTGCASSPDRVKDPRDPLEPFNRAVFRFNTDFDNAFMKPAAKAYRAVTPDVVDRGITNFFANLDDVTSLANNVLQFKLSRAGSDLGRIFINTTVGVLGFVDVATNVGLQSYKEDFDQTLGYWGLEPGAFLMLPILGPSSIRGTLGWAGDIVTDPLFSIDTGDVYWGLVGIRLVDYRADRLAAGEIMEEAALDPYVFLRDAYMQRRRNLVYDGNPPQAEGEEDLWEDVDFDSPPTPKASTPAPPASDQSEHEFPR